ncbi:hypothetical protein AQUCO_00300883v1 [Aquilegia coerulea]|uniref:DUF3444 domain-containing protein n=1 Tax=Aquilegia coerulea TaxID=218851 RepID=A0A2G5F0Z9_AQUCA|nr:hypothetical protein AQUCO_00300883v1 [Aquilegia coerulea]
MSRGTSGSFNVRNDPTDEVLLSKGSSSKTTQQAVFGKFKKEKGQEGSVHVKEGLLNGSGRAKVFNTNRSQEEVTIAEHSAERLKGNSYNKLDKELNEVNVPEFYVFDDNDRKEDSFRKDQVWAVYDETDDCMPRLYAQIRKVFSPGFKVRVTWLVADPDDGDEIEWVDEDLPVSCGKFRLGRNEITEDRNMFSHPVTYAEGTSTGSLLIYPTKGETLALFKNWDIKWSYDPDNHRNYEYIFVKILSDYNEVLGIMVVNLEKVKGSVSICSAKMGVASYRIPLLKELYMFSHMVPSYGTTGYEKCSVPEGSFELGLASVPANLMEECDDYFVGPHRTRKFSTVAGHQSGAYMEDKALYAKAKGFTSDVQRDKLENQEGSASLEESYFNCEAASAVGENQERPGTDDPVESDPGYETLPDVEKEDCFKKDQIWAIYDNVDAMPRFYAMIRQVFSHGFKVKITWLEANPDDKDEIDWVTEDLPVSCGYFNMGSLKSLKILYVFSYNKLCKRSSTDFTHDPSYRTIGYERVSVPEGSFELDPASVPTVLVEYDYNDFVGPHRVSGSSTVVGDKSEASLKEKASKTTEPDCFAADIKNRQFNKKRGIAGFGESSRNGNVEAEFCKRNGKDNALFEDYKNKKCKTEENRCLEQNQPGPGRSTFWTACPSCKMRYQYYKDILNSALRCQSCMRPFVASDSNVQSVPSGACMQPAVPLQKEVTQSVRKIGLQGTGRDLYSCVGDQVHSDHGTAEPEPSPPKGDLNRSLKKMAALMGFSKST